jgi:hypothetical protein
LRLYVRADAEPRGSGTGIDMVIEPDCTGPAVAMGFAALSRYCVRLATTKNPRGGCRRAQYDESHFAK